MNAKHAPGKLDYDPESDYHNGPNESFIEFDQPVDAPGRYIRVGKGPTMRADAARLAACWNACDGINPEAVPALLAACKLANDELLALGVGSSGSPAMRALWEALALAEGP